MGDCIVDACVLQGASDSSSHIDALNCFNVINEICLQNHILVCNVEIYNEWLRHLNTCSSLWLAKMISSSRVIFGEANEMHVIEIESVINSFNAEAQAVANKDKHILALALTLNALVISSETRCRAHFVNIGKVYAPVSGVYWTSPLTELDLVNWIKSLHVHGLPHKWLLV